MQFIVPVNPNIEALLNSCLFAISFCIVGKKNTPPNENRIVPNANENDEKVGFSYSAIFFSGNSIRTLVRRE